MLSSLLLLGFQNTEIVKGKGFTAVQTVGNEINAELTIADLEWYACDTDRDLSLPFSPSSSGGYSFDQTASSLHILESTGTYLKHVGFYTSFSTSTGIFSIDFDIKVKAGHIEAINSRLAVYNNQTKMLNKLAQFADAGEAVYYTDSLETPYFDINGTFILEGFTEVLLFFYYSDGFSADWNQEFWIENLVIETDIEESSLPTEKVTKIISNLEPHLRGIFWKDDILFCGMGIAENIFEVNPITGAIITEHEVHLDGDITFDGTSFWTSATHIQHNYVQKFDSSFGSAEYFYLSFTTPGGIAFDGTNLWIANHVLDVINKVDSVTGNIISSIPAPGTRARGLQYYDDYLWVADSDTHQFYKISPDNGTVLETYDSAFNFPMGITVDDEGYIWLSSLVSNLIYKTNVNANPDQDPPVITPSADLIYEEGSSGNYISWILEDDNPGTYELYRNDLQVTGSPAWADGQNLSFNVDLLPVGTYNYTVVAIDVYDNRATSTIWVTVIDSEETSFFWISSITLLFVPFISKRRRK